MNLDKIFLTKTERINLSIKESFPHKITHVNGYVEWRPVSKRIARLGRCWWSKVNFTHLYYPN